MQTNQKQVAIIILAAGLGTRMKSNKAKVLHSLNGIPMIHYVVDTAYQIAKENVVVVTGHQSEEVQETVLSKNRDVCFAYQEKQLGTGHAVLCALPQLDKSINEVVILCGDVPLLSSKTVSGLIQTHREQQNDVTVLGVEIEHPTGYGRMVTDQDGHLVKIVEEKDADEAEKLINVINSGIYCVEKVFLESALNQISPNNVQKEYYLTDIISIGNQHKKKVGLCVGSDPTEVMGINSVRDLHNVELAMQRQEGKTS